MAQDVRVNMDRALCLSHTFHLLMGAGRAALLPFLSLYLRLLGLTATQTGLVFGARAFMTMVCTPAWTTCAKRFNKKKIVLMFSLFMMLAMYLTLCLVPPADKHVPLAFCHLGMKNGSDVSSDLAPSESSVNGSFTGSDEGNVTGVALVTLMGDLGERISTLKPGSSKTQSTSAVGVTGGNEEKESFKSTTTTSTTSTTTTAATSTSITTTTTTTTTRPTTAKTTPRTTTTTTEADVDWGTDAKGSTGSETKPESQPKLDNDELTKLLESLTEEDLDKIPKEELDEFMRQLSQTDLGQDDSDNGNQQRRKRSIIESVRTKWQELSHRFELAEYQTFVFVLLLMIVGELFAAPHDKLADDVWFEYLDILDSLERFGGHRVWQTVGAVIVPTMIAAVVDHTPCILPLGIHHFLLHFLAFAALTALAFLLALCYPVSQNKQTAKRSRLGKGLRVLCGDPHAISMSFTMVVVGVVSAVVTNFLFWRIQDLGGPELTMGVCVAVAGGSEFVVRLIGQGLVKRLTHTGSVTLALLLLSGVLVFYSLLPSPWLAVGGAVFHGLAVTLLWVSVQTYPDFRINPFVMDRSAASLITSLHVGVGFAVGSMVSGIIYDKLGYMILFQGTAGLTGIWMIVFLAIQRLWMKKEKVRYAKLLQDENMEDSDESVVYEDDWLEVAMKRDR